MEDGLRPSREAFEYTLRASFQLWSSYFNTTEDRLPLECLDLKGLLKDTPAYLAAGLTLPDKPFSFACTKIWDNLEVKGQSKWRTSRAGAKCITPEKIMPLELHLGIPNARKIELSAKAPLSSWPGVRGIVGFDEGNHIAVLVLAWAYILSAKWAELLNRSEKNQCTTKYSVKDEKVSTESEQQEIIEIDLPPDTSEAEIVWWDAVLSTTSAWEISTEHKSEKFLSPWSISLSGAISLQTKQGLHPQAPTSEPPSSSTAFQYLTRYCTHYRIYAQCSASLSATLFLRDPFARKPLILPFPRPGIPTNPTTAPESPQSIPALLSEHEILLPYYMTLGSNMVTTTSAMKSTFFNPSIPCNLVAPWTNAAFAMINPILAQPYHPRLLNGLAAREPRVASLWLGATITGTSSIHLKCCEQGLMGPSLEADAWIGTTSTFMTQPAGVYEDEPERVQREDECKILFLATPSDDRYNHGYMTVWPWKPFGYTRVCDTDTLLREHLRCGCHAFEYGGWSWELDDGPSIEDVGAKARFSSLLSASTYLSVGPAGPLCLPCSGTGPVLADLPPVPRDCGYDLYEDEKSSNPSRGIFCWLRIGGFAANEEEIYKHPWVTIMDDTVEEVDEKESDDDTAGAKVEQVKDWIGGVEVGAEAG